MAPKRERLSPQLLVLAAFLSIVSFLAGHAAAAGSTGQLTVFWGRHKDEGSLREACDSGLYTTVIMSFLDVYGHGEYHLDLSGHPLAGLGDDIKHCQLKGVAVSLSIGGLGGNYSLPTTQSALDLSDHLWHGYLGGSRDGVRRPFGDARLDGVDFFLERGSPADRYDVLARELAKHSIIHGDHGKPLRLTATPRCAFPSDRHVEAALATGVFDGIHVGFYGDRSCSPSVQEAWEKWTAAYPGSRIYLGLAVSEKANGYLYPKSLYYGVLPAVQSAANYGGIMVWDRYFDKQDGYTLYYLKRWA